jgi:hypothetical protein
MIGTVEGILEVLGRADRSRAVLRYITLREGINDENGVAMDRGTHRPVERIHGVMSTASRHDDDGRKRTRAVWLEHHIHVWNQGARLVRELQAGKRRFSGKWIERLVGSCRDNEDQTAGYSDEKL